MKSVINHLVNYKGTADDGKYTLTFHADCWDALENSNDYVTPDGTSWRDYVESLGWLTV